MRMLIDIQSPVPPFINSSYGSFGFYKFGVCCWQYNGYDGAVEFINTLHFCTEPKYDNVSAFRYWFQQGVTALVTPQISVKNRIPDFLINGVLYNAVTGKGMPLKLPV